MGMKKSEKLKGKEKIAAKKQKQVRYGVVAAACCIIIAIVLLAVFNPFVAKVGDTVQVYYTGTLDDGTVFDTNTNSTPLVFRIGAHTVIPGFEEAMIGMSTNQVKTVHIPVDKAYGPYRSELVRVVNRSGPLANVTFHVGDLYSIRGTSDGATSLVKILNVTPGTVIWDENHLLAGKNLTFEIRLVGFTSSMS